MSTIACRITAIPASDRPRYLAFLQRVRQSVVSADELPTGYAIKLGPDALSESEFQEWVALEALCCPFLDVRAGEDTLRIVSAPGVEDTQTVKQLIANEFLSAPR